jgi:hypothetical protein
VDPFHDDDEMLIPDGQLTPETPPPPQWADPSLQWRQEPFREPPHLDLDAVHRADGVRAAAVSAQRFSEILERGFCPPDLPEWPRPAEKCPGDDATTTTKPATSPNASTDSAEASKLRNADGSPIVFDVADRENSNKRQFDAICHRNHLEDSFSNARFGSLGARMVGQHAAPPELPSGSLAGHCWEASWSSESETSASSGYPGRPPLLCVNLSEGVQLMRPFDENEDDEDEEDLIKWRAKRQPMNKGDTLGVGGVGGSALSKAVL